MKVSRKMSFWGVLAVGLAASASPALAQEVDPQIAFVTLDKNKDEKISLDEFLSFEKVKFDRNDANSDGKLTPDEFKASLSEASKKNGDRTFAAFDQDKNGSLSFDEYKAYRAYVFKNYMDTDKDGSLSLLELMTAMQVASSG